LQEAWEAFGLFFGGLFHGRGGFFLTGFWFPCLEFSSEGSEFLEDFLEEVDRLLF